MMTATAPSTATARRNERGKTSYVIPIAEGGYLAVRCHGQDEEPCCALACCLGVALAGV